MDESKLLLILIVYLADKIAAVTDENFELFRYHGGRYDGKETTTLFYYNSNGTNYKITVRGGLPDKESKMISWLNENSISYKTTPIKPYPLPVTNCGLTGKGLTNKIIGGKRVSIIKRPWQAAIVYAGTNQLLCGGSIISKRHILTAAHCLKVDKNSVRKKDSMTVYTANEVISDPGQKIAVESIHVHKKYDLETHRNDIALIYLSEDIEFGQQSYPICLAQASARYVSGSICTISGWGTTQYGKAGHENILRTANVPIVDTELCSRNYRGKRAITSGEFCAGEFDEGGIDTCQGDSGGPFACKSKGLYWLQGVTSRGKKCGLAGFPGVYTKVSSYLKWIENAAEISVGNRLVYDKGAEKDLL